MSLKCRSLYTWNSNGQNTIWDGEFSTVLDLAPLNGTYLTIEVTVNIEKSFNAHTQILSREW